MDGRGWEAIRKFGETGRDVAKAARPTEAKRRGLHAFQRFNFRGYPRRRFPASRALGCPRCWYSSIQLFFS